MAKESQISWKDKRKEELREGIVAEAVLLFREKGFDAVSIDEIVRTVGIAKGTFYLYFKTKADLVNAAADQLLDDLEKQTSSALNENSGDASKALRAIVGAVMTFIQENPGMLSLITNTTDAENALASRWQSATTSVCERLLRMGMLQGHYREIDPELAAHALFGMLAAMIKSAECLGAEVGELAVDFFERGIRR
jgi:AcrR family transcriptional regulator